FSVELVHRRGEAAREDRLHRVGGGADELGELLRLGAREVGEQVVGRVVPRRRAAHADPHARERGVAQICQQRADAVVAAVAAAGAQLETAERQVELVVHDDDLGDRHFPETGHPSHRLSADVHVFHRFAKKDALARDRDLAQLGAELGPRRGAPRAGRKLVHHLEPQVVPVVLVFRSRIAEPDHEAHAGPLLACLRDGYFPFFSSLPAAAGAAAPPLPPAAGTAPSTGAASASTFSAFGATTEAMASRGSSSARTPSPSFRSLTWSASPMSSAVTSASSLVGMAAGFAAIAMTCMLWCRLPPLVRPTALPV